MNKLLIVANWKMNPQTAKEAKELFNVVARGIKNSKKNVKVVICSPFVYLQSFGASAFAKGYDGLALGSQDCFWEQKGAYTGEISPRMLKNLGCSHVIIGHSERELNLRETQAMANKKIKAALKSGLKVIFCVGERAEERDKIGGALRDELHRALHDIPKNKLKNLAIVYEPVWAIGTGNPCHPRDACEAKIFIQKVLADLFGEKLSRSIPILYGGSVTAKIAADYITEGEMSGLLVGGASLNAREFVKIVDSVRNIAP